VSSTDTFTAFVESLAEHLDDHEANGADLAARLYLSRSHFDRIVAATAGETPARFRRRVLLERAAFRLLTSSDTVLDIAIDMDMWNEALALRGYDFGIEAHEPRPELKSRLDRVAPVFLEHVRTVVDEGRLDETFVHAQSNPPKVYTYGGLIAHVLTFAAHRRMLVAGALASAGVTDLGNGDPRELVAQAQ
jgi:hypothetical protein